MSRLAIITARGGSKRIPKKNIKEFCGKPIIAYAIEAAKDSGLFSDIIISTDCNEIAKVALELGANCPFMRSDRNSDDFATTMDVVNEVTKKYQKEVNPKITSICCIYPTAPFITEKILRESSLRFEESDFQTLVPVTEFSFPIQRAFRKDKDFITWRERENSSKRSQDLEKMYHDVGQFYWFDIETALSGKSVVTDKSTYYEIPSRYVQDIDTLNDWEIAEFKYQYNLKMSQNE